MILRFSAGVDRFTGESKVISGAPQEPRSEAEDPEASERRDSPNEVDQAGGVGGIVSLIVEKCGRLS
jgi:hypothetical protein